MLKQKIKNRESGLLFYGITPPKFHSTAAKVEEVAQKQIARLQNKALDGLILYDIQDESSRNLASRPFPLLKTVCPQTYSENYLRDLKIPKVIYRCVGNYSFQDFESWLRKNHHSDSFSVFVGAPSRHQKTTINLKQAYALRQQISPDFVLGGVMIPERHQLSDDEHLRVVEKMDRGCEFFVSQCVYSLDTSKNFLADYYYYCQEKEIPMAPQIFTLTPCGSLKTLEFMKWLGIHIPKWLERELQHSSNILDQSMNACKSIARELLDYAFEKQIPIGFNIESVAIRKSEIEASIDLLDFVHALLRNKLRPNIFPQD